MASTNSSRRLQLAAHVRASECDGDVILLDLSCNRYLSITRAASEALAHRVEGWPKITPTPQSIGLPTTQTDITASLIERGILTESLYKRPPDGSIEDAAQTLELGIGSIRPLLGTRRAWKLLTSVAKAKWWMQCRSMKDIVQALTIRRAQQIGATSNSIEAMAAGTAVYEALRPLLFTAREECMLDSLALVTFLATEGLTPHWVVGVKTNPFGAHAWVQSGNTVLNDQHGHVRQFRPILVV